MSADQSEVTLSLVDQAWTLTVRDRAGAPLTFEQGLSPTRVFATIAQFCDASSIENTTPINLYVRGRRVPKAWRVVDMLEAGKIHLMDYMED